MRSTNNKQRINKEGGYFILGGGRGHSPYWGGGRIRDVASLIRRTDEPEIKKNFWGKKSKKTFSPEAKKIF